MASRRPTRIVCVGDEGTGKTALQLVYSGAAFPQSHYPTVSDSYNTQHHSNPQHEVELIDTPGSEDLDRLRPFSYDGAQVVLLCFAINDPRSLANVEEKWLPETRVFAPSAPVLLVGLKKDLRTDRLTVEMLRRDGFAPISTSQALAISSRISALGYRECSARTGEGVSDVFELGFTPSAEGGFVPHLIAEDDDSESDVMSPESSIMEDDDVLSPESSVAGEDEDDEGQGMRSRRSSHLESVQEEDEEGLEEEDDDEEDYDDDGEDDADRMRRKPSRRSLATSTMTTTTMTTTTDATEDTTEDEDMAEDVMEEDDEEGDEHLDNGVVAFGEGQSQGLVAGDETHHGDDALLPEPKTHATDRTSLKSDKGTTPLAARESSEEPDSSTIRAIGNESTVDLSGGAGNAGRTSIEESASVIRMPSRESMSGREKPSDASIVEEKGPIDHGESNKTLVTEGEDVDVYEMDDLEGSEGKEGKKEKKFILGGAKDKYREGGRLRGGGGGRGGGSDDEEQTPETLERKSTKSKRSNDLLTQKDKPEDFDPIPQLRRGSVGSMSIAAASLKGVQRQGSVLRNRPSDSTLKKGVGGMTQPQRSQPPVKKKESDGCCVIL
ncbi:hypothetical protein HK097_002762 [Rhizophlyctis rosea]|uniref:Uncharacterized protein n=1 Tax=Rhizophlyctis rosea TaxID=64517 RepID=A0AAD5S525_9FUNG|nr:hypothetical protein HK097_002762 [Rhizophlyctis rosea]